MKKFWLVLLGALFPLSAFGTAGHILVTMSVGCAATGVQMYVNIINPNGGNLYSFNQLAGSNVVTNLSYDATNGSTNFAPNTSYNVQVVAGSGGPIVAQKAVLTDSSGAGSWSVGGL